MKPNKQIYIDFIISQIESGKVGYNQCSSIFCTKYNTTDRTFAKYWKLANDEFNRMQQHLKQKITETTLSKAEQNAEHKYKLVNKRLLSIINKKHKVEEKSYDITIGKVVVFYREPNPMEIIEAIKEYNRINGI